MNTCNFTGRIGQDLQIKKTQGGKSVTNFTIGNKRNKDVTEWIPIVIWGQAADYLGMYAKKGDLIAVYNGVLQSREYEGRKYWEVHSSSVEILSHSESKPKSDGSFSISANNRSLEPQKQAEKDIEEFTSTFKISNDDLPF